MTYEGRVLLFCLAVGYNIASVITDRHQESNICWHSITLRLLFCLVLYKTKWPDDVWFNSKNV